MHNVYNISSKHFLELWTTPVKKMTAKTKKDSKGDYNDYKEVSEDDDKYWRAIEKIIIHSGFKTEALSWKGFDYALVKLSKSDYGKEDPAKIGGIIAPACLAEKGFPNVHAKDSHQTFMAGFGRREIPYCITDNNGPEAYEICGMNKMCAKEHRATSCDLEFLYGGKTHKHCITSEPSPSSKDENCVNLRSKNLKLNNVTVHLFDSKNKYVTTCYPLYESENPKGWCSVRRSGVEENTEPQPTKGWGFCSNDPWQKHCNGEIQLVTDMLPRKASMLTDRYCVEALKDNLQVEQPDVTQPEYDPLTKQHKVFCVGKNHTHSFKKAEFYINSKSGQYEKSTSTSGLKVSLGLNR